MCRNIKTLFNFEPPATELEIRDASLQFVRKLSGFNVPSQANAAAFDRLQVQLLRDDGAVVYLNGTEVLRDNLPAGTITHTTLALTAVGGADERTYFAFTVSAAYLVEGTNVLAVEVHQAAGDDLGMVFGAGLNAIITPLFESKPSEYWLEKLRAADILCGPINTVADVLADPALKACLPLIDIGLPNAAQALGTPIRYNSEFFSAERAAPAKGQHTREVLTEIGYSVEEIEGFLQAGNAFIEAR